ncbi:MAG: beta-propeller fold lactonase family protein [Clostridium sp.]|uniref:beta-propeller fold lactonase family protein n=1 Tax=Clostridium sp. TaxID=1506 RepID=UPI003F3DB259
MGNIYLGFIGTYTKKKSDGIYRILFDSEYGKFLEVSLAYNIENPTYLSLSKDNKTLFSIHGNNSEGGLCSFNINNLNLEKLHCISDSTKPPCFISNSNNYLFTSNYHEGIVNVYSLINDFDFNLIKTLNTTLKDSSKMHFSALSPNNKLLATCNLSLDKISMYKSDDFTKLYSITLTNNSGPRHIEFHSKLNIIYVLTEITAEIFTIEYDDWGFNIIDVLSLYDDSPIQFEGAAIHMHPSNKFVYVSERKKNCITCCSILKDGTLKLESQFFLSNFNPRDFNFTPDGEWLIVASLLDDKLSSYKVDTSTGKIHYTSDEIIVPEPTCVIFNKNIS